jgi:hypothetical protein
MFKRKPYAGTPPAPLDADEFAKLQRWEWWMIRFYTGAMIALIAAIMLIGFYGQATWARRTVIYGILALVVLATWVQFREQCPRCQARIGRQSRLVLPPKCKHCGVKFVEPRQNIGSS